MSEKDSEMSFLDHLEIFRWHLIRAAAAIMFFAIIAFIYKDIVFDVILNILIFIYTLLSN